MDLELSFDLPSRLADQLNVGDLDVALIPSIEALKNESFTILSDACIGCFGNVWSVKLLSRVPFEEIKTMAVDEGSRTSIALTKVLLNERYGIRPQTEPLSMSADPFSNAADAVLIIGDRAMTAEPVHFPYRWDLGGQWHSETGLPFVFAMWTARKDANLDDVSFALSKARDHGLENLDSIARDQAPLYQLSYEDCFRYLSDNLHFTLGEQELLGLDRYRKLAFKLGVLSEDRALEFHDCKRS